MRGGGGRWAGSCWGTLHPWAHRFHPLRLSCGSEPCARRCCRVRPGNRPFAVILHRRERTGFCWRGRGRGDRGVQGCRAAVRGLPALIPIFQQRSACVSPSQGYGRRGGISHSLLRCFNGTVNRLETDVFKDSIFLYWSPSRINHNRQYEGQRIHLKEISASHYPDNSPPPVGLRIDQERS